MSATDFAHVLQAGGMVPADAKLGKDDAVDAVVARAYRHAVLPGRTIVRLSAAGVVAGDDLEMATLGFGAGEDRGTVGKERRRPLGFPGWALVHDPKNARYALDVVKEFKKHARKAKSKPGHAKDGLDAIAVTLGKTVPHFLPSFFEEAGRVFIEHGSPSYAATMFAKAREAEAVHALDVDEQHRVDAFLEFALAGAVTTKALTEYAKQLADHHEPPAAYAHFRQLCVQRTLGGMPPWGAMAKDLHRLANAAKLDPDAEDAALVEEIVESPALAKAAGEFWRAYAEPIAALGKAKPSVRGALLNLFPTGTGQSADLDDAWLDLLETTGAIDALITDGAPAPALPNGGRAAWFDKLTQHLSRHYQHPQISHRAFALLRRMAPALIADGAPIACAARWSQIDLDLAELALELGVPFPPPTTFTTHFDLLAWAKYAHEPARGRDPVRVAAHPVLGKLLASKIPTALGADLFDARSHGKTGFAAAKRAWLDDVLARAERGGLPAITEALDTITAKVKSETFAELPDLYARLAALAIAPALARTLRIGLLDEFGWPALEAAAVELGGDGSAGNAGKPGALTLHGGLPVVIVANATRAIAVDANGRLATHDLVLPAKSQLSTIRYIGGQFLVALKVGYQIHAYWSSAPHDVFPTEATAWATQEIARRAVVRADGAWHEGGKAIRVGDRTAPTPGMLSHDGTTAWMIEHKDGHTVLREIAASGEPGRASWPAFLEAGIDASAPEWRLDATQSYVLPMPAALAASPLGSRDGLLGVRVRYRGDNLRDLTARELVTIDGRTWTGPMDTQPAELLVLPTGESRPLVIDSARRGNVTSSSIVDGDSGVRGSTIAAAEPRYWAGSIAAYPLALWHALAARELAGSQRLRAITDDDAAALLAALAGKPAAKLATLVPVELVAQQLPAITDARLQRGVAGVVALAAALAVKRDELRADRSPDKQRAPREASGPDDDTLKAALGGWAEVRWAQAGGAMMQVARIGELFRASDRSDRTVIETVSSRVMWFALALKPGALAFIASTIGPGSVDKRRAVAALLAAITRELPEPSKLRMWLGTRTVNDHNNATELQAPLVIYWHKGNAYAIARNGWNASWQVLEYAPTGVFAPLPPFNTVGHAQHALAAVPATDVAALAAALAAGTSSWSAEAAQRLATATGLTPSEATYLWAGCPSGNDRSANFMDRELREQLGLKATQAALARDLLAAVPVGKRLAAIAETGAAVLRPDGVDVLAAAWVRHVGKRIAIPEALLADADDDLQAPLQPGVALAMIGNAAEAPRLNVDGPCGVDANGNLIAVANAAPVVGQAKLADDREAFGPETLATAASYLPFLYAELPVGDPLRAQAPIAHALVLERLRSPTLLLANGYYSASLADGAGVEALVASLGGDELTGLSAGFTGREVRGGVIVRNQWTSTGVPPTDYIKLMLHVRPATYDAKAAAALGQLLGSINLWGTTPLAYMNYVRGDDVAAMMARITETPVPVGGWEQNPLASVPALVAKAAAHLGVSREAAALYLQFLVLLWPTPKNVARWNDWKPKQVAAATAELVAAELLLEAKRERAQRAHFLPGGWEALKSPHPPLETWKLAMYARRNAEGGIMPTLTRFLALAPFHLLFARAWARIEAGDVPKYDEVKR